MNKRKYILLAFCLSIVSLLITYQFLSNYFKPLVHEEFISYLQKEKGLSVPFQHEISEVHTKINERLGQKIAVNSRFTEQESGTIYVYFVNVDSLRTRWKPKSYDQFLMLITENCRAIQSKRIIYCDIGLFDLVENTKKISEIWAGILSHELGHLLDMEEVFEQADQLYEQRITNMLSFIDKATSLFENNQADKAFEIIAKVKLSDDSEDLRVVAKLALFHVSAHQHNEAYNLLRTLILEGKTILSKSEEKYLDLLGYQSLAAHCLTALNKRDEARKLYQEIISAAIAEGTQIAKRAKAGVVRTKYHHEIPGTSGLVVVSVDPDEEGTRLGICAGDILISINGNLLYYPEDAGRFLNMEGQAEIHLFKAKTNSFGTVVTGNNRLGVTLALF
jgi:tetratricopeptide (TPR) repeat protein